MGNPAATLTPRQNELELALGQPIDQILIDALRAEQSMSGAARRLCISKMTMLVWLAQRGIDAKAEVARGILEQRSA